MLVWESHMLTNVKHEPYERSELSWRWRRQVAAANGRPFLEPAPKSPGEVACLRLLADLGGGR
jgi:hypothetical protein